MSALVAPVLIGWEQGPVRRVRVERRICVCIDCDTTFEATVKAGKVPPRCPSCRAEYDWNVLRPRRLEDCQKRNPGRYPDPSGRLVAAKRERRHKRRAAGLCVVCETPTPHYRCDDCRDDFNAARSVRKARRVKLPRCVDCGATMKGARADRRRCDWCRRWHKNRRARAAYRDRKANKG